MDVISKLTLVCFASLAFLVLVFCWLRHMYRKEKLIRQIDEIKGRYLTTMFAWEGGKVSLDSLLALLERCGEEEERLKLIDDARRLSVVVGLLVLDYEPLNKMLNSWPLLFASVSSLEVLLGKFQVLAADLPLIRSWVITNEERWRHALELERDFAEYFHRTNQDLNLLARYVARLQSQNPQFPPMEFEALRQDLRSIDAQHGSKPLSAARRLEALRQQIEDRRALQITRSFFNVYHDLHQEFDESVEQEHLSAVWQGLDQLAHHLRQLAQEVNLRLIVDQEKNLDEALGYFGATLKEILASITQIDQARQKIASFVTLGFPEPLQYKEAVQRAFGFQATAVTYLAGLDYQSARNQAQLARDQVGSILFEMEYQQQLQQSNQHSVVLAGELAAQIYQRCQQLGTDSSWPAAEVEVISKVLASISRVLSTYFNLPFVGGVATGPLVELCRPGQSGLNSTHGRIHQAQVDLTKCQIELDHLVWRHSLTPELVASLESTINQVDGLRLTLLGASSHTVKHHLDSAYWRLADARSLVREGRLFDAFLELDEARRFLLLEHLQAGGTWVDILDHHQYVVRSLASLRKSAIDLRTQCLHSKETSQVSLELLRKALALHGDAMWHPHLEVLPEPIDLLNALRAWKKRLEKAEDAWGELSHQLAVDKSEHAMLVGTAITSFRRADQALQEIGQIQFDSSWAGWPQWVRAEELIYSVHGDLPAATLLWATHRNEEAYRQAWQARQGLRLHAEKLEAQRRTGDLRVQAQREKAIQRSRLRAVIDSFFQIHDAGTGFISPIPSSQTASFSQELVVALPAGWQLLDQVDLLDSLYDE